jgi:hypothetical protein
MNRVTSVFALLVLLWGCVTAQQYDAASDIRAFLIAVRDGDRQTFDEHVDHDALKTNLKSRLLAAAAAEYGPRSQQSVGALLAGPLVDVAVNALVRPQVFKAAASLAGYGSDTRIPPALMLGHDLKAMGSDRVCALVHKRCVFVFKREDGVWRLIDFEGDVGLLLRGRL